MVHTLTKRGYIDGKWQTICYHIYGRHTDPSWVIDLSQLSSRHHFSLRHGDRLQGPPRRLLDHELAVLKDLWINLGRWWSGSSSKNDSCL